MFSSQTLLSLGVEDHGNPVENASQIGYSDSNRVGELLAMIYYTIYSLCCTDKLLSEVFPQKWTRWSPFSYTQKTVRDPL